MRAQQEEYTLYADSKISHVPRKYVQFLPINIKEPKNNIF